MGEMRLKIGVMGGEWRNTPTPYIQRATMLGERNIGERNIGERNIGERITELTGQFNQVRQMAITEELLDIAGGFEAMSQES